MGKLETKQYAQQDQLSVTRKPTKNKKKPVKITYISNPTMVRATNASEFRALVQELTGKDSKELFWESCTTSNEEEAGQVFPCHETPNSKIVEDVFSSYTSSSVEMDDCCFWNVVSESLFESNFHHVFV